MGAWSRAQEPGLQRDVQRRGKMQLSWLSAPTPWLGQPRGAQYHLQQLQ